LIGVAARETDLPWVTEFFELFKTPWEAAVVGKHYRVLLSAGDHAETFDADLTLAYGTNELEIDRRLGIVVKPIGGPVDIRWKNETVPIYCRAAGFSGQGCRGVLSAATAAIDYRQTSGQTILHRIGYDLFEEVSQLLTRGQPKSYAETPTLELHIELIRQCLQESGISYVEIPARPYKCAFVCCLTHDVDFFGICRHTADRTLAGFLARGTVGTLLDVVRGRRPFDEAVRNWLAVLSLPLVFLGLGRDFWQPFEDYARADRDRSSTFFLIPFKGLAGVAPDGATHALRAAPYNIREIRKDIEASARPTTEFALHGIDAWRDSDAGRAELKELAAVTGQQKPGIRMHWLYFSDDSPRQLEEAGFAYDSTWGYSDAVGYRAGTSQVFHLPGTESLLELPLAIMDSALFYTDRMGLDRQEAMERCRGIVQNGRRFGGAIVINWHDRSLAPERQWGRCYKDLLNEIQAGAVWFATAAQAVEWFQWRRTIRFSLDEGSRLVHVEAPTRSPQLPAASLIAHRSADRDMEAEETRFTGEAQTLNL
jgi:hypothetical protein